MKFNASILLFVSSVLAAPHIKRHDACNPIDNHEGDGPCIVKRHGPGGSMPAPTPKTTAAAFATPAIMRRQGEHEGHTSMFDEPPPEHTGHPMYRRHGPDADEDDIKPKPIAIKPTSTAVSAAKSTAAPAKPAVPAVKPAKRHDACNPVDGHEGDGPCIVGRQVHSMPAMQGMDHHNMPASAMSSMMATPTPTAKPAKRHDACNPIYGHEGDGPC